MLLRDDVVADRQPEAGALAGRLGGEKGLEQFVPYRRRDSHAVVAHPNLDRVAFLACRDREQRAEPAVAIRVGAFVGGVEAVAKKVEEHPRHVLRHQFDRRERPIEIALQRDVEARVSRPRTVIGEVQRVVDQRVEVDLAPIPGHPARVFEHALDDVVGALAVFGDLFEIARQHADRLIQLRAFVLAERFGRRPDGLLQLTEQFVGERGEVVDEVEGVLDLVRDPGGELSQRCHLLRLDEARLRRLQVVEGTLRRVARPARLGDEPCILDRDRRLRRKAGQSDDLRLGKRPHIFPADRDNPEQFFVLANRDVEARALPAQIHDGVTQLVAGAVGGGRGKVRNMHDILAAQQIGENRRLAGRVLDIVPVGRRDGVKCRWMEARRVINPQNPGIDVA